MKNPENSGKEDDPMMLSIKQWIAPPVFPDDENKTRRADLLNHILLTLLVLVLCLTAGILAGGRVPAEVSGLNLLVVGLFLVLRHWNRHGRVELAGGALMAIGFFGITAVIAILGTICVPATALYILLVVTAGLLFDLGGMIVLTALCSLAVAGLIGAQNAGMLPRPDYTITITQWVTYTVLFIWAGSLTFSAIHSMRQAIVRANREITRSKQIEEQLREASVYTRSLIEVSLDPLITISPKGKITDVNTATESVTGISREKLIGSDFSDYFTKPEKAKEGYQQVFNKGFVKDYSLAIRHTSGKIIDVLYNAAVYKNGAGDVQGVFAAARDITRLKQKEEELHALLEEKTTLLHEVHHRVKNNMQIISSLLSLQAARIKNKEAIEVLRETANRIHSMALLHETLNISGNLSKVNFSTYIKNICAHIIRSYGSNAENIKLENHITDIIIDLDQAVPCGLIINELVSNALKHAFPGGRKGRIILDLKTIPDDQIMLTVADDGIGLPPGLDIGQSETLGLKLVTILTDKLKGNIEIIRDPGTTFNIMFKAKINKERQL